MSLHPSWPFNIILSNIGLMGVNRFGLAVNHPPLPFWTNSKLKQLFIWRASLQLWDQANLFFVEKTPFLVIFQNPEIHWWRQFFLTTDLSFKEVFIYDPNWYIYMQNNYEFKLPEKYPCLRKVSGSHSCAKKSSSFCIII